jgi:hypothetical protein
MLGRLALEPGVSGVHHDAIGLKRENVGGLLVELLLSEVDPGEARRRRLHEYRGVPNVR